MKRFSEMSPTELKYELGKLQEEKGQALKEGQTSKADMLERRYYMGLCYTLSTNDFPPGIYEVIGQDSPFKLEYLNGIMAWGSMGEEKEISFPISTLRRV
jgi:hypothetical protein